MGFLDRFKSKKSASPSAPVADTTGHGWDPITTAFESLYPGQKNPSHRVPAIHRMHDLSENAAAYRKLVSREIVFCAAMLLPLACGKSAPDAGSASPERTQAESLVLQAPLAPAVAPEQVPASKRQPTSIRLSEFAAGDKPRLSGPFAGLLWGMSHAESLAAVPDVVDAETVGSPIGKGCQYEGQAGWCTDAYSPLGLTEARALAMRPDDQVLNHLKNSWGPPDRSCAYTQMEGRHVYTWMSTQTNTFAQLIVDNEGANHPSLRLRPYKSLEEFIGPPQKPLGFLGESPTFGLTVQEIQERFSDCLPHSDDDAPLRIEHELWFGSAWTRVSFDDVGRAIEFVTTFPMETCRPEGHREVLAALQEKFGAPHPHPDAWRDMLLYPGGVVAAVTRSTSLEIRVGNLPK